MNVIVFCTSFNIKASEPPVDSLLEIIDIIAVWSRFEKQICLLFILLWQTRLGDRDEKERKDKRCKVSGGNWNWSTINSCKMLLQTLHVIYYIVICGKLWLCSSSLGIKEFVCSCAARTYVFFFPVSYHSFSYQPASLLWWLFDQGCSCGHFVK